MNDIWKTILDWFNEPFVRRIAYIILGLVFIFFANFFVKKWLNRSITNTDNKYKARKTVNFFAYFLFMLIILIVFNDKIKNIGVVLGVFAAGIAFALQEVIMSFAGWLNIIITGKISVGQRIKVGEIKGDVIDIGIMSTTFMEVGEWVNGDLYNGCISSMTNSFVFKENIHNYSAEFPFLWDEINVPIRINSDYKSARNIFIKVLDEVCGDFSKQSQLKWKKMSNKFRVEEAQVLPMVTLVFNENWITFTLRYVVDYKKRRGTKDIIFSRILDEIQEHENIQIASSAMEITDVTKRK